MCIYVYIYMYIYIHIYRGHHLDEKMWKSLVVSKVTWTHQRWTSPRDERLTFRKTSIPELPDRALTYGNTIKTPLIVDVHRWSSH